MYKYISLLLFIGLAFWSCSDADSAGRDSEVVGIWDISNFTINNTSHIYGNNIILSVENIYPDLMDGTDWNFQENGDIIIDVVTSISPLSDARFRAVEPETVKAPFVVTLDVPIAPDGIIPGGVLRVLQELGKESEQLKDGVKSF